MRPGASVDPARCFGAVIVIVALAGVIGGCSSSDAQTNELGGSLAGTMWLAEDIGQRGVLDRAQSTLDFGEAGDRVSGRGGCNRYTGPVEITGSDIHFGALSATRMACPPALMDQEQRLFAALDNARSFGLTAEHKLVLYDGDGNALARFSERPQQY